MAIEINHNVNMAGLDKFEAALNRLAQLTENSIKSGNTTQSPSNPSGRGNRPVSSIAGGAGQNSRVLDSTNKLAGKFDTLTQQIQSATNALAEMAKNQKAAAGAERVRKQETAEDLADQQSQKGKNRWRNIGSGIMGASLLAAMYQAGNVGQVMGSESQSINAGANNYNTFMRDYSNRRLDMEKNISTTGAMAMGGAIGSAFGLPGMLIGGAAAGGFNYWMGDKTERDKAMNEFAMGQDPVAYQMRARGLSGASDMSIKSTSGFFGKDTYIPVTELQKTMIGSADYAGYAGLIGDVGRNVRSDQFNKSTAQQADFIKQVGVTGMVTGETDYGSLAKAAGNLAAMSNKDVIQVLKEQTKNSLMYNGKALDNMNKITQIMQHSGMGYEKAQDLVNRYQFNDPALRQSVSMTTLTPQQGIQKVIYSQLIKSITGRDMFDSKNVELYKKVAHAKSMKDLDPTAFILAGGYSASNFNPYVNMGGAAIANPLGDQSETQLQKDFMNQVAEQLANITVGTQNVTATSVNVYTGGIQPNMTSAAGGAASLKEAWSPTPRRPQKNKSGMSDTGMGTDSNIPPIVPSFQPIASDAVTMSKGKR